MKREKIIWFIFGCLIFLAMYIFFVKIHPLVIYDADDWTYISQYRKFVPIWVLGIQPKYFQKC